MTARKSSGEGSFRKKGDLWVGSVELPPDATGKRKRREVSSKVKATALAKFEKLKADIADGVTASTGSMTVERWLQQWLVSAAAKSVGPRTLDSYRSAVNRQLIPTIGRVKLADLKPSHIRKMHDTITATRSSGTALNAHWVIAGAMKDAVNEGLIRRSPVETVDPPRVLRQERGALSFDEAKHLLRSVAVAGDPFASRWAAALLLGARQAELLGLRWQHVDLDRGVLELRWQLQRLKMRHGCKDGTGCGWAYASKCPDAVFDVQPGYLHIPVRGNLALVTPKTVMSKRPLPIPAPLLAALRMHRDRSEPNEWDLVWVSEHGLPLTAREDRENWAEALANADLPPIVLHEARHTTATLLRAAGVDPMTIAALLGHSSTRMQQLTYVHIDDGTALAALSTLSALMPVADVSAPR